MEERCIYGVDLQLTKLGVQNWLLRVTLAKWVILIGITTTYLFSQLQSTRPQEFSQSLKL